VCCTASRKKAVCTVLSSQKKLFVCSVVKGYPSEAPEAPLVPVKTMVGLGVAPVPALDRQNRATIAKSDKKIYFILSETTVSRLTCLVTSIVGDKPAFK